jgi:hypothetical protein
MGESVPGLVRDPPARNLRAARRHCEISGFACGSQAAAATCIIKACR